MTAIDERKKRILEAVVREHIVNASPVGSRTIARRYDIDISPATIRNEMADLEEMGYLEQPHTSAGRVPSDQGYRFYVDHLIRKDHQLSRDEELLIRRVLRAKERDVRVIIEETSRLLSMITDYTSLVLEPSIDKTGLEKIHMVPVDTQHVLIVIITDTGIVENKVVSTSEQISRKEIEEITDLLNSRLHGMTLEEIDDEILDQIEREIVSRDQFVMRVFSLIQEILSHTEGQNVSLGGTPNILEQPEFKEIEKVKKLLGILEEERILTELLKRSVNSSGVVISIGNENDYEEMRECSLIMARYRIGTRSIGSLGVLGPTRMDYARAITAVDYISRCLSEALTELNS